MNPADLLQAEGASSYPRAVRFPALATAAEVTMQVPAGVVWEVISLCFTLVTDANVATRAPRLTVDDGTNVFFQIQSGATQAAGATLRHTFAKWLGASSGPGSPTVVAQTLPELVLPAGYRVMTSTAAIQVGDQYSLIVAYVYETVGTPTGRRSEQRTRADLAGVT